MDKAYFVGYRNITQQLLSMGFPEAKSIAIHIVDKYKNKIRLTDDELEIAKYLKNFLYSDTDDISINEGAITRVFENTKEDICKMIEYLYRCGYSEGKVRSFYRKNPVALYCNDKEMKAIFEYLCSIGLNNEQVINVFLKAICIGLENVKMRCEHVLKYFDISVLYTLSQGYLFYIYYTDPIDAINYIVDKLGIEKSRDLLKEEDLFLYLWKEEWQRCDYVHGKQHKEALLIVEKYKRC